MLIQIHVHNVTMCLQHAGFYNGFAALILFCVFNLKPFLAYKQSKTIDIVLACCPSCLPSCRFGSPGTEDIIYPGPGSAFLLRRLHFARYFWDIHCSQVIAHYHHVKPHLFGINRRMGRPILLGPGDGLILFPT